MFVRRRLAAAVRSTSAVDLCVRLRLRRACGETAEHANRCTFERRVAGRPELHRHPQPVVDRERITFRHDADDRGVRSPKLHRLADRRRSRPAKRCRHRS